MVKLELVSFVPHSSTDLILSQDKYRQMDLRAFTKATGCTLQVILLREIRKLSLINLMGALRFKVDLISCVSSRDPLYNLCF